MSSNLIEVVSPSLLEAASRHSDPEVARAEFNRLTRFTEPAHAKGADIAARVQEKIAKGVEYRRPLLPLAVGNTVLSGFFEGMVPTEPITDQVQAEGINQTLVRLNEVVEEVTQPDVLYGTGRVDRLIRYRFNEILDIRGLTQRIVSVEPVLHEDDFTEVERGFVIPVREPAVRVELTI